MVSSSQLASSESKMSSTLAEEDFIDTEALIHEVRIRPALYDHTLLEFSDQKLKAELWKEVIQTLFSQSWGQMSAEEKSKAGKLASQKWENIRSRYATVVREQQLRTPDQTSDQNQSFKHHDLLSFLSPTSQGGETNENTDASANREEPKEHPKPPVTSSMQKRSYKEHLLESLPKQEKTIFENRYKKRNQRVVPEKKVYFDVNDAEKHFALSLIPMLRALPAHHKLHAQIRILQVLQNLHIQPLPGTYTQFGFNNPFSFAVYPR